MSDLNDCLEMDRDAEVTKYISGPWKNHTQHERFVRNRIETHYGVGLGYWSIFLESNHSKFVGWILLIPYDGVGPEIEIGWRLNRTSWGMGYATEATLPIVKHAFNTVGVAKFFADIDIRNNGSMRVAEKIGMQFTGDSEHAGLPCKSYIMTKDKVRF